MDNKTDYHSIASILTSLGPEGRGGDGIGLVYHVAELFEHEHDGREKAFLAELLAALLSKSKDVHTYQSLTLQANLPERLPLIRVLSLYALERPRNCPQPINSPQLCF